MFKKKYKANAIVLTLFIIMLFALGLTIFKIVKGGVLW